jgi:repressor LexA
MATSATSELTAREIKGLAFIRDSVLYRGKAPTLQAISDHVGYSSKRASSLLVDRLIAKGLLARTAIGGLRLLGEAVPATAGNRTVDVPLVGCCPCGTPLLSEENIEATISVSQRLVKPGGIYFLLRAVGNSMDEAGIEDGELVLVRQTPEANDGDRIVALVNDEATIKELKIGKKGVALVPRSSDPSHRPIILDNEFTIQGVVVDAFPNPGA